MGQINITPAQLAQSAQTYRQDLLMMAVIALQSSLKHMTLRTGIRYKETVGELSGGIEIGPYSETRIDDVAPGIAGRSLETFFGSVVKNFSPNSVYQSLYGSAVTNGPGLQNVPITNAILFYLMKQLSKALNANLWSAVRNDAGSTTADLFNGFDTITGTEIAAGNISVANNNLYAYGQAIDRTNAVDILKAIYRAGSDELQNDTVKLFIPKAVYNFYVDDYQTTVGPVPYNTQFNKTFLEGSNDLCELVALPNKKNSQYIHMTDAANMLVGTDNEGDLERITVEKHAAFVLQFIVTLFFGCQFETISYQRLLVATQTAPVITPAAS
jgi:hypothetical protein